MRTLDWQVDIVSLGDGFPHPSPEQRAIALSRLEVSPEGVPVVVVSADALAQQIDAAFEAGCAHYLTKPVNVAELLAVVDDLLEQMDTQFG